MYHKTLSDNLDIPLLHLIKTMEDCDELRLKTTTFLFSNRQVYNRLRTDFRIFNVLNTVNYCMCTSMQSTSITELSNQDVCPCCHSVTDLEPHHWSYEPEVTIGLCRSCHLYIHNNRRVREQGDDWQQECIERLAMLDAMNGGASGDLRDRYNIPDSI